MSEMRDAGGMLEAAEQAVAAGDLARADELLRGAARIQEAEFGPLHPDLANTLNNLAVVAEKTGRPDDAETFYRRAVTIASASFPVDHPMVAASRQNLEDFCRARGLPIHVPVPITPVTRDALDGKDAFRRVSRERTAAAIGIFVVLVAITFLVVRPWSRRDTSRPTAQPPPPAAVEPRGPAAVEPTMSAPAEQPRASAVAPSITLATVQLCRTLSTSGASWQCEPADDPVSPGSILLYTRVRSVRDTVVEHRWFRGDTLRRSVKLPTRASPTEGYRTYSRQVVDGGAAWRVEVRSAEDALLHEERFVVR